MYLLQNTGTCNSGVAGVMRRRFAELRAEMPGRVNSLKPTFIQADEVLTNVVQGIQGTELQQQTPG